jgi:hypothetical protein
MEGIEQRSSRWLVAVVLLALSVAGNAQAGVTDCDGVLNDAQKEQRRFCDTHAGCSLVTSIMDSCISVKSFLKALSSEGAGPGKVNDAMVSEALEEIGVPKPGVASCTVNFDRSQCRQFLGVEQAPVPAAPAKYTPTPTQEIANEARELRGQQERASLPGDEYRYATNGLAACAQAIRSDSKYEQVCNDAQRKVDDCTAYREAWYQRRKAFLARASTTSLADAAETIARLEMPYCPTTLSPVDPVTPPQAIARRKAELEAPPRVAAAPQPQEFDVTGQWVEGVGQLWEASLASTTLSMRPGAEAIRTFERISPNVYRSVTSSDCLMTARSAVLMEMTCKGDVYRFIPLAEVKKRTQGRIDLTGTWEMEGNTQPVADFRMSEVGLVFDPGQYGDGGKAITYLQTSPSTYATAFCTFTVISANRISDRCESSPQAGVLVRLTAQQVSDAKRSKQTQVAPALVISFNGDWRCDNGNRVHLEDRENGFAVTGTGASGEFFYRKVGDRSYRYSQADGFTGDFEVIDNDTIHPSDSNGNTDVCHRE